MVSTCLKRQRRWEESDRQKSCRPNQRHKTPEFQLAREYGLIDWLKTFADMLLKLLDLFSSFWVLKYSIFQCSSKISLELVPILCRTFFVLNGLIFSLAHVMFSWRFPGKCLGLGAVVRVVTFHKCRWYFPCSPRSSLPIFSHESKYETKVLIWWWCYNYGTTDEINTFFLNKH